MCERERISAVLFLPFGLRCATKHMVCLMLAGTALLRERDGGLTQACSGVSSLKCHIKGSFLNFFFFRQQHVCV